jgi:hypothetical protein
MVDYQVPFAWLSGAAGAGAHFAVAAPHLGSQKESSLLVLLENRTARLYAPDRPSYHRVMSELDAPKPHRTAFSAGSLLDLSDEKAYWLSKTPSERLQATDLMRRIVYGHDPATRRLQSLLEVAQRPQG